MRHVEFGLSASQLDRGAKNDNRGGAVDVVVAVDQHALAVGDSAAQALDGGLHAEHAQRVVKVGETGVEKVMGVFGSGDFALGEQRGHQGRQAVLGLQAVDDGLVVGSVAPAFHGC